MSTRPWRGTLIFAGTVAAVAATAVTRFAGAEPAAPAGAPDMAHGTTSGVPASSNAPTQPAADPTGQPTQPAADPTGQPTQPAAAVTIVGSEVQTRYGPLQLSVTFEGSDITAVEALEAPSFHGESVQINAYAIPVLNAEAVAADSARIDAVSGATITTRAYLESLQAAIDQRG